MTTKEQLQAIIDQADFAESNVSDLEALITGADTEHPFETNITQILTTFDDIRTWTNGKILEAEQAQVMAGFLGEMKVVFEKYSAKLEIGDDTGYGSSYGGDIDGLGIRLTATLNNITAAKTIEKAVITKDDLV